MNLWEAHLKLVYLTEEIDRRSLRKAKERDISEIERLDREMDRLMADYLELKNSIELMKKS